MSVVTKQIPFSEILRYSYGYICPYSNYEKYWRWQKDNAELRMDTGSSGRLIKTVFAIPEEYKYFKTRLYVNISQTIYVETLKEPLTNVENKENNVVYNNEGWFLSVGDTLQTSKNSNLAVTELPYNANGYQIALKSYYSGNTFNINDSYLEVDVVEPKAINFEVTGTSIDEIITCTWCNEDVANWKIEVIKDNQVVCIKTGTDEEISTFKQGDLKVTGNVVFKLTVYNEVYSNSYEKEIELTGTHVKLFAIEPSITPQKLYEPIIIKVSGENMSEVLIECTQNNVVKYSKMIQGNNLKDITTTVLAYTFTSGSVAIKVTANYKGTYYSNTTTQTVKFTAYGPPNTPVLEYQQEYATPCPVISWHLDPEQIQFEVVLNGTVVQNAYSSKIHQYACIDLQNNTYNTIKVRIKNAYNEWSEYATATFLVQFAELNEPVVSIYVDMQKACITIIFSSEEQELFLKHAIYRKKQNETTWQKIKDNLPYASKYSDYGCSSNVVYEYKVRAISTLGTFKDSDIIQGKVLFEGRVLSVPGTDTHITLTNFETIQDSLAEITFNSSSSYLAICGLSVPKQVKTRDRYKTFACRCCCETQAEYEQFLALEDEEILLYRDGKGEAFYCTIQITSTIDSMNYYKYINFVVTETYYSGVEYDKPVYFGYSKREW